MPAHLLRHEPRLGVVDLDQELGVRPKDVREAALRRVDAHHLLAVRGLLVRVQIEEADPDLGQVHLVRVRG